jgi:hypothetical protein
MKLYSKRGCPPIYGSWQNACVPPSIWSKTIQACLRQWSPCVKQLSLEMAQCYLTVACMLHRYVWYYLTWNETARWNRMLLLLTRNAVYGCREKKNRLRFQRAKDEILIYVLWNLSFASWIVDNLYVEISGFIWNELINLERVQEADPFYFNFAW